MFKVALKALSAYSINIQNIPEKMGKILKGTAWSMVERFSVQGIQFILSLVIARILLPSDYGLIAMLTVFTNISQVFVDSGFSKALIQKQNRTETDLSTVFYFNIAVSILVYIILFVASPYIATFYKEPQLEIILKFTALNIVITSFSAIQNTILLIKMDFKRSAYITLIAVIISGSVALWLAYHGYGVWTLVFQAITNNVIITLLLWLTSKWRPKITFSIQSFKEMFGFGSKLLGSALITAIYNNLYSLVIGRMLSSKDLGLYNRGFNMANIIPANVSTIFTRVTFTAECEMQDDEELLQRKYMEYIRMISYVVFPLLLCLVVIADPLIRFLLTDKWAESIPIFQILCIASLLQPVMLMNWQLVNVKRRSDYALYSEIIKKIIGLLILVATISGGLYMLCWGLVIYEIADMVVMTYYTRKILPQISIFSEMKNLSPILGLGVAMAAVSYGVNSVYDANNFIKVVVGILVCMSSYVLFSIVFKSKEYKNILSIVKSVTKQK